MAYLIEKKLFGIRLIMKKIWILCHDAMTPYNGTITRHFQFVPYLKEAGYEVKLFASSKIHNSNLNEITDKRLYLEKEIDGRDYVYVRTRDYQGNGLQRVFNMLDYHRRVQKVCKKFEKPDVIYASSPHLLTLHAALKIAKKLHVPCICEVRDLWPESIVVFMNKKKQSPVIRALYRLERSIYRKADALIFTMAGGKEYIQDKGWQDVIDLDKVHQINNGVDLRAFDENRERFQIEDEDLQEKDRFRMVYVGSIRKANQLSVLLEAAKLIQQKGYSKIQFLIWGEGNEREALAQRAQEEGIHNFILKGFVAKQYIPYIVSNSDANIVHWGNASLLKYGVSYNKLFDYLAAGRPIFSTVRPGYSIVQEKNCGIHAEDPSPEGIAEGVLQLYQMAEDAREQMGKNARDASYEYDFKALTGQLIEVIESLEERGKKR